MAESQKTDNARLAWMRCGGREGDAAILDEHGHTSEALARLVEPVIGPGPYEVHEVWMHHTPRVKWCERIDSACDSNGEWHGHWSEVRRNPLHPESCAVSVVFPPVEKETDRAESPATESDADEQEGECPTCYAMGPVYTECEGAEDEPHEATEFLP